MWLRCTIRFRRVGILSFRRSFQVAAPKMAKSRFEYVKSFETEDRLDPKHWIVIALKHRQYDDLADTYNLEKPNDRRLVQLFEECTRSVMSDFKELVLAYGFGAEFSLVFAKNTTLYRRRAPKLLTNLCSLMASSFVQLWPHQFKECSLIDPPVFEGTVHLFPDDQSLRDYMTQRQLVCHHRNLNNTLFWSLVQYCSLSVDEAQDIVKGTKSEGDKNEILFSKCNKNYNKEEDVFKKGTIIVRTNTRASVRTPEGLVTQRNQSCLSNLCYDFVKDQFWSEIFVLDQPTKVNAKTNYLKDFEKKWKLLPHSWIVIRIDGKGFHKFSEKHSFMKPNDIRSIELMNRAAKRVMEEFPDIILSYGQSDEYTFVVDRYSRMLDRCSNMTISSIVSLFGSTYVYHWVEVFEDTPLQYSPAFDARAVLYPNNSCLRDYLSWRQADCHINNMYNTCFWVLVQEGNRSRQEAEEELRGTFSKDKKAILSQFSREYDEEDALYRKGTVMYRDKLPNDGIEETKAAASESCKGPGNIAAEHVDMIGDAFWEQRPWILSKERTVRTLEDIDY